MITSVLAGIGTTCVSTFLFSWVILKAHLPLRARGDGRPIGGPALGAGVGIGLAYGLSRGEINPFFFAGAGLIAILGLVDDRFDLSPVQKLIGQSVAAALAMVGIGNIGAISIAGAPISIGIGGYILAFFWILALANGVNLIDGLDGLAIGVTTSATLGLLIIAATGHDLPDAILGAAALGGMVGFYPWNQFRARLLLGDTGAELIGYLLALLTIQALIHGGKPFSILPALLFAAVPIADTAFAVLRRLYHHRAIFHGDRGHIHHRLKKKIGERKAVLLLSLLSLIFTGIGAIIWANGL